jgi:hypothetical protein
MRPIAVHDYPKGSPMLLLPEERVYLIAIQERPRHHRQLLADDDTDSDKSQGDQPSHASVSMPSSYHNNFPDSTHLSIAHPTGSAPNVSPNTPQNLKAKDLFAQAPPSSRYAPPTASTQAVARYEFPPYDNIGQTATTSPADFAHHLWMIHSVHEHHSIQIGLPTFTLYGAAALPHSGMLDSETSEYNACRHAFPYALQRLFPMVRPDDLSGQYFHLTQILYGTDVDPITGLSRSYQILIFFDSGYNEICKDGVQKAARARFEAMGIVLTRVFFLYFDSQ